jgi:hypothetical protein
MFVQHASCCSYKVGALDLVVPKPERRVDDLAPHALLVQVGKANLPTAAATVRLRNGSRR